MQRDMREKAAVLTYADIAHSQLSRMQRDMCEKETYLRMQRLEMSEKDTAVRQLQREVSSAYVCQQYVSIRMSAVYQHTVECVHSSVRSVQHTSAYVCQQYVSMRMSAVCQHAYVSSMSAYS